MPHWRRNVTHGKICCAGILNIPFETLTFYLAMNNPATLCTHFNLRAALRSLLVVSVFALTIRVIDPSARERESCLLSLIPNVRNWNGTGTEMERPILNEMEPEWSQNRTGMESNSQ